MNLEPASQLQKQSCGTEIPLSMVSIRANLSWRCARRRAAATVLDFLDKPVGASRIDGADHVLVQLRTGIVSAELLQFRLRKIKCLLPNQSAEPGEPAFGFLHGDFGGLSDRRRLSY